jgi:hypothetical protein
MMDNCSFISSHLHCISGSGGGLSSLWKKTRADFKTTWKGERMLERNSGRSYSCVREDTLIERGWGFIRPRQLLTQNIQHGF